MITRPVRTIALLICLATILPGAVASAQDVTNLAVDSDSELWVDGKSNRDDWTVHAADISGSIRISGSDIEFAEITIPAGSLSSDRTIMDRLMHSALKTADHPSITFRLGGASGDLSASTFRIVANGTLTLAGETRDVEFPVDGERRSDGTYVFSGSVPISMSDYGISPPVAMFGSLRTADDVVVSFKIVAVATFD